MDFAEVIRRQRMTRRFAPRPVPPALTDAILAAARKAPSAGHAQGTSMLVLEGDDAALFWSLVDPRGRRGPEARAPTVIVPLANKQAYLDRYAEPDKARWGMHVEEAWPAPYWLIDCAFAAMTILLAATAAGLGCWFFGIFAGKEELLAAFDVPPGLEPIGAIALGHPAGDDIRSASLRRGRKPFGEFVHRGRWGGGGGRDHRS